MDRIAGILVSYQADFSLVQELELLCKQDLDLIVVDNGSDLAIIEQIQKLPLVCITLGTNKGLAYAQNQGISYARDKGYDFVCFFDQDSGIPQNYARQMLEDFRKIQAFDEKIAILAPDYVDKNTGLKAHFAKLDTWSYQDQSIGDQDFLQVTFAISSGSLIPIDLFEKLGLFQEAFFIDHIDTEFSLRLKKAGYHVYVTKNVCLSHTIGNRTLHRFLGMTIKPNHHGAHRKFWMTRNAVKCMVWYGARFPIFVYFMHLRMIHDTMGVILYEQQKASKLLAMGRGWFQGFLPISWWKEQ